MQQKAPIIISLLLVSKQWGKGGRAQTTTLPISYSKFYIPAMAFGANQNNWAPAHPATVNVVSLSQINFGASEGTYFSFITIGI